MPRAWLTDELVSTIRGHSPESIAKHRPANGVRKRRSRFNAVRHGLTAETVVACLEDAEDYHAFEATIIAHYCPQTAVARELVLRLASLVWRLRRATPIEHSRNRNEIPKDRIV